MLRKFTAEFTIFSLLFVIILSPVSAQTRSQELTPPSEAKTTAPQPDSDLKKIVSKDSSPSFDPVKADAIYQKQAQQQPKKWSKTKKVLVITAIAVGVAALLFVAIKYAKECARTEPANCDYINDEFCRCVEYVPRNP